MSTWTEDELSRIAAADELQLASRRRDGTLRPPVTIWVVRVGGDVYVRPVNGRASAWFRGVQVRHEGHVDVGGVEKDVSFVETDGPADEIDAAYREKYRRYPTSYVDHVTTPDARAATLRLDPTT
ncbi:MAG TPA: DUF2255 family protein [Gaiellaceae bacterium]|nr:DUF2255 family protein [Gaiellaceae bacterium]